MSDHTVTTSASSSSDSEAAPPPPTSVGGHGQHGYAAALREVWTIAWPTVLTMTSYTVMQFFDKLMVGQVGPVPLAAQSNGGIWSFALLSFALGVLTVVNTYVSQNLGAGTPQNGPKYAWAAFWLSLTLWAVFMIPYGFALPLLFSDVFPWMFQDMAGHSAELTRMETGYAQVLVFGSLPLMLGRGLNQFFFGMHRPRVVTLGAIAGNITNVVGNYILIFGENGLPSLGLPGIPGVAPMGVYGAAISTVIGTVVEMAIPAAVMLGPKMNRELRTRAAWRPDWKPIRDLLRIGWPASIQWGNELICWAIFMAVLVGGFGDDHMTACGIAFGYMHLSFMPAIGLSVAVNSLVGKYIGAGKPDIALSRAHLCLAIAMTYMTICAAMFVIFRETLIGWFVGGPDITPERAQHIIDIGAKLLICTAVFQTADAFGIVYTGALRGAGDTVWPGVVTAIYAWVFIIGGGLAFITLAPELESLGPWIASAVYVTVYGMTMWLRFHSGKWRAIRLLEHAPAPLPLPLSETALKREAAEDAPLPGAPPAPEADAAIRDLAVTEARAEAEAQAAAGKG
jgi:multidrug resistance protein, MATE family